MLPGLGPLGRSSMGGGGVGFRCGWSALGPVGAIPPRSGARMCEFLIRPNGEGGEQMLVGTWLAAGC